MSQSTTPVKVKQEKVEENDTNLDLKKYLTEQKFTEYWKIEPAMDKELLTLADIFECNEKELKDELASYEVSPVQRNRFVKAIKQLPQSKMNEKNIKVATNSNESNSNSNSRSNSNSNSNSSEMKHGQILLSTNEQKEIDQLSHISDMLAQCIKSNERIKENNRNTFKLVVQKVKCSYCT